MSPARFAQLHGLGSMRNLECSDLEIVPRYSLNFEDCTLASFIFFVKDAMEC